MAVKIRLKRMGTTKRPFYRIVVADSRSPRDGRSIEEIGILSCLANSLNSLSKSFLLFILIFTPILIKYSTK